MLSRLILEASARIFGLFAIVFPPINNIFCSLGLSIVYIMKLYTLSIIWRWYQVTVKLFFQRHIDAPIGSLA